MSNFNYNHLIAETSDNKFRVLIPVDYGIDLGTFDTIEKAIEVINNFFDIDE